MKIVWPWDRERPLDHQAKLAWASHLLSMLEDEFREYVGRKPYDMRYDFDTKSCSHRAFATETEPPPLTWSLLIGDIVHNLRSSLDTVAYLLAVSHAGRQAADESRVQFPLVDDEHRWRKESKRIRLLHPRVQAEIEQLQPFCNPNKTAAKLLIGLRDLSNSDKHERIQLVVSSAGGVQLVVLAPDGTEHLIESAFRGPLEFGTLVAEWPESVQMPRHRVMVHGHLSIDLELRTGRSAAGESVRAVLNYVRDHIRDQIFPQLERYLSAEAKDTRDEWYKRQGPKLY